MKRQDGLGTSPKRPRCPYDSMTDSDTNSDRESLDTTLDNLDSFLELEAAGRLGGCTVSSVSVYITHFEDINVP